MPDRPQILRISLRSRLRPREYADSATLGVRRGGQFPQGPTNSVTGSSAGIDARPLRPTRSRSSAFSAELNGDLEDRFLQKSSAGQRRVRVMGEEDREVTGWDRKPAGRDILVKLDVPLLVKCPNATVTC